MRKNSDIVTLHFQWQWEKCLFGDISPRQDQHASCLFTEPEAKGVINHDYASNCKSPKEQLSD